MKSLSFFVFNLNQCSGTNFSQAGSCLNCCRAKLMFSSLNLSTLMRFAWTQVNAFFAPYARFLKNFIFTVAIGGNQQSPKLIGTPFILNDLPSCYQTKPVAIFIASDFHNDHKLDLLLCELGFSSRHFVILELHFYL